MLKKLAHPALLSVAGLACLTAAAFVIHLALGLAIAGVSLVLIEWRIDQ